MHKTKKMALVGVFGALAFIVMLFVIPFPLTPWLKFDISDIVVLFSGLIGGVSVAIGVAFIKILLHTVITSTQSAGIGEITNFVATLCYVLPIIFLYNKTKMIIISLLSGILLMTFVMLVGNYYFITPFYAKLFKMDFILEMMAKGDSSYFKYIIYYYGSFNLFKGAVQSVVYYLIHKKLNERYLVK